MRRPLHVPIRHRILIALLLVVTAVVSTITFTMANLFHADKKVYVFDLASVMAVNTAEKVEALVTGYGERLMLCVRVFEDPNLSDARKVELIRELMHGFRGCVEMSFWVGNERVAEFYDNAALERGRLTSKAIEEYRAGHPLPFERLAQGRLVVENSTLGEAMPAVTVAVPGLRVPGKPLHAVCAMVRLDDLQRVSRQSQAFEVAIVDGKGTLVSHRDPKRLVERRRLEIPNLGSPTAAEVGEYNREGVDRIGAFARVGIGDLVVAAEIPKAAAFFASRELLRHLVLVALALLVAAAVIGTIWSRSLTRSIGRLAGATHSIAAGDFNVHVDVKSGDEIGTLAESFNQMATELHRRDRELKEAQGQLIQSEKMAAFGQLGAGFAHEIKNPLAGIQGLVQLLQREVPKDGTIHQALLTVEKETKRCRAIIDNLMKFARQEKVAFGPVDPAAVVTDACAIMEHQLGIHGVKLEKSIEEGLAPFEGNGNQLQQVLMNLILNAQQAVEGGNGRVRVIAASGPGDMIELRVEDNGPGIPMEIQARIFEPFFTTKPPGKGTGLGLSVSYGIVQEHKGTIALDSGPDRGTTFIIRVPKSGEPLPSGAPAPKTYGTARTAPTEATVAAAPAKAAKSTLTIGSVPADALKPAAAATGAKPAAAPPSAAVTPQDANTATPPGAAKPIAPTVTPAPGTATPATGAPPDAKGVTPRAGAPAAPTRPIHPTHTVTPAKPAAKPILPTHTVVPAKTTMAKPVTPTPSVTPAPAAAKPIMPTHTVTPAKPVAAKPATPTPPVTPAPAAAKPITPTHTVTPPKSATPTPSVTPAPAAAAKPITPTHRVTPAKPAAATTAPPKPVTPAPGTPAPLVAKPVTPPPPAAPPRPLGQRPAPPSTLLPSKPGSPAHPDAAAVPADGPQPVRPTFTFAPDQPVVKPVPASGAPKPKGPPLGLPKQPASAAPPMVPPAPAQKTPVAPRVPAPQVAKSAPPETPKTAPPSARPVAAPSNPSPKGGPPEDVKARVSNSRPFVPPDPPQNAPAARQDAPPPPPAAKPADPPSKQSEGGDQRAA